MADQLEIVFAVHDQLTVSQILKRKGWKLFAKQSEFVVTNGDDKEFKFAEDELGTCQTIFEQTYAKADGGIITPLANRGYSRHEIAKAAVDLGFEDTNDGIKRAAQHIVSKRRDVGTGSLPELTFIEVVSSKPDCFVMRKPQVGELSYLQATYPMGKLDGEDFIVGGGKWPVYDTAAMREAVEAILQTPDKVGVPERETTEVRAGPVKLLDELMKYKDFNRLINEATKDVRASELKGLIHNINSKLSNTQKKEVPKLMPVCRKPADEYIAEFADRLRKLKCFTGDLHEAAQVFVFLRSCQVTYVNGSIEKKE